jgi:hypothetical protein
MFRQRGYWISCERGKLGRSHLRATLWCVWVSAVSEGGWNILRTETWTSPISRAVVDRELLQLSATSKSRRAHQTRPKDNSQKNCSAAWSGAPCGTGDDGDFGISGSLCPLGFPFAYRYRGTQNGWELLQSGFGPLRLQLVRALERSPERSPLRDWCSPWSRAKLVARSWNGLLPQRHL